MPNPSAKPRTRPRATPIAPEARPSLRAYLGGNFGLTFSNGVQNVLLGWLVAHELGESGSSVGLIMAALMLPNLALSLLGGFLSDRFDPQKLLPGLNLLAAGCVLTLIGAVASGRLNFSVVLLFALAVGALTAFIAPARDALMSRVAGGALPRVVPLAFTANYVGQLLGALVAGMTERVGAVAALEVQAGALVLAAACFAKARPVQAHTGRIATHNPLHEIRAAWQQVRASPPLRTALAMMVVIGLTLGGTYVPLMTMMTRDVYHGGSLELSLGLAAMMVGTTSGSLFLSIIGGLRCQGVALLVGLTGASLALGAFALEPTFPGALVLSFVWGLSGAIGMVMTRTISQENASETHRARVLSLFHLALTGSAPAGSLAIGWVIDHLGAATAGIVPGTALLVAVLIAATTSSLPRVESIGLNAPPRA